MVTKMKDPSARGGKQRGREKAYQYLREYILADPANAGTYITEATIAEAVGVSRTPVREALFILAAQELVELVPNRGAFIPPVNDETVSDIIQARAAIEVFAALQGNRKNLVPLKRLEEQVDALAVLPPDTPSVEFLKIDRDFHLAIVEAINNPILVLHYDLLRARHLAVGVLTDTNSPLHRRRALAEHRRILQAFKSGDEEAIKSTLMGHLASIQKALVGRQTLIPEEQEAVLIVQDDEL